MCLLFGAAQHGVTVQTGVVTAAADPAEDPLVHRSVHVAEGDVLYGEVTNQLLLLFRVLHGYTALAEMNRHLAEISLVRGVVPEALHGRVGTASSIGHERLRDPDIAHVKHCRLV